MHTDEKFRSTPIDKRVGLPALKHALLEFRALVVVSDRSVRPIETPSQKTRTPESPRLLQGTPLGERAGLTGDRIHDPPATVNTVDQQGLLNLFVWDRLAGVKRFQSPPFMQSTAPELECAIQSPKSEDGSSALSQKAKTETRATNQITLIKDNTVEL